jgi:hypothetical protein
MKMIDNVLFQRALVNFQRHPICGDERAPFYAEPKYCPDIKEQVLFLCRLILTLMIQTFKDRQYNISTSLQRHDTEKNELAVGSK